MKAPARLFAVMLLFLPSALTGCRDTDVGELQPLACEGLQFSSASAQPLDMVTVRGVSGGVAPLVAEVRAVGGEPGFMPMQKDTAGSWSLVVPPHPNRTLEGGPVEVVVTDGETRCPTLPFAVAPLEPAPGAFHQVIEGLQRQMAVRAQLFGYTPKELVYLNTGEVPAPLIPLILAQVYLDHPDNPRAVGRLLIEEPPAPLVDALWAKSGLGPAAGETVETLRDLPPFHTASVREPVRHGIVRFASSAPAAAPPPASDACPGPASFYQPSAAELDRMMTNALRGDIATTGKAKQVFDAFTFTLGVGAAIPVEGAREGFTGSLQAAVAYKYVMEGFAKLLPRRFTDMEYELSKTVFLEDDAEHGELRGIRVTAMSDGWNLDQNVATYIANAVAGALAGQMARSFLDQAKGVYKESFDEAEAIASELFGEVLKEGIKQKPGRPDEANASGTVQLGPCTYGPTDVSDPEWNDVKYTGPAVQVVLESQGRRYEPKDVGTSAVIVSTPPKKFGFQLVRLEKPIRVLPIRVLVEPPTRAVEAGEKTWFRVVVDDAQDGGIDVSVSAGAILKIERYGGATAEHYWRVEVQAPADDAKFPAQVRAISTADRSHLRSIRERAGDGRLILRALHVRPQQACLKNGEAEDFHAEYDGKRVDNIRWSADRGGISAAGNYRAPARGDGTVTITAVDRANPELQGETEVTYGAQCNSRFSFTTRGDVSLHEEGGPVWGVSGVVQDSLCLVSLHFVKKGEASDAVMSLSAALPDGLREGRYPIGRLYTGRSVDYNGGEYLEIPLSSDRNSERASPGVFFAHVGVSDKYSQARNREIREYSFPFDFTSETGTVDIRRFEGNRVEVVFEAEMIEKRSELEQVIVDRGARLINKTHPLRTITVEGRLTHTLKNSLGIPDMYICERLDPVPSTGG